MIERFLNWCLDQDGLDGMIYFTIVGVFMCATGLAILVLIWDIANEKSESHD